MAEENDTLKLTSVNYTTDNYLAAKKNEDGSYNVEDKVVFEQDITTPGGKVATKADLDGKQDQLTSDNAGDNITITGEGSTLKINAAGGGGELKSKGWLCIRNGTAESGCDFKYLETHIPSILESVNYKDSSATSGHFNCQIAKIVFNEEKSMAEVSKWLFFDAIMVMGYASVYDDGNYLFYAPHAICPWPEDKPWK